MRIEYFYVWTELDRYSWKESARMSPYIPDYNPIYNQDPNLPPLNFQLNADTINPVLFTVVGGVITEVIPLPITGFAYEG